MDRNRRRERMGRRARERGIAGTTSRCWLCPELIERGDRIVKVDDEWIHFGCVPLLVALRPERHQSAPPRGAAPRRALPPSTVRTCPRCYLQRAASGACGC